MIDQSAIGQVVTGQMAAIEQDHGNGAIGAVVLISQVVPKAGEPEMRLRWNVPDAMGAQIIKEIAARLEAEPDDDG